MAASLVLHAFLYQSQEYKRESGCQNCQKSRSKVKESFVKLVNSICQSQYIYIFKEKTKPIFTENISATAFINSLLSTSHFSLMLHFKTNLQVIIYII